MKRRGNGEGSIRRRTDGRWTAQIYLEDPMTGLRKRHQVYGRTRSDALDKMNALKGRLERGEPATDVRMTVSELLRRWMADVVTGNVKPNVLATYSNAIKMQIEPTLGCIPIAQLRPATIEHVLCGSAAIGSPRTREIALMVLSAAFKTAIRWRLIAHNPAHDITAPKRHDTRAINPMTPAQLHAFLAAAAERRLFALYVFAAFTGARQGEILALQWRDVDLVAGTARVAGTLGRTTRTVDAAKTARSRRTVRLTAGLSEALAAHGERMRAESSASAFVFVSEAGTPLSDRNVLREFKEILIDAGLAEARTRNGRRLRGATLEQSFRFHDLRHTYATLSLLAGVPLKVVSEQLGHASIQITADTYTHLMPAMQDDAAFALDAYFQKHIALTAISTAIRTANG